MCFIVTMEQTLWPLAAATRLDYVMLKIFARRIGDYPCETKAIGIVQSTIWLPSSCCHNILVVVAKGGFMTTPMGKFFLRRRYSLLIMQSRCCSCVRALTMGIMLQSLHGMNNLWFCSLNHNK